MTPDIESAQDYARIRSKQTGKKPKILTIRVKPEDVRWNTGSYEVEFDGGGKIVDGKLIPHKENNFSQTKETLSDISDPWTNKKNCRLLSSYRGLVPGNFFPKTKEPIIRIYQYRNGDIQLETSGGFYSSKLIPQ